MQEDGLTRGMRPRVPDVGGMSPRSVLLVAGVSGSGKSTFIAQLGKNWQGCNLRSVLPAEAAKWPLTEKRRHFFARVCDRLRSPPGGQILHHEITHSVSAEQPAFKAAPDVVLSRKLVEAERIFVVVVGALPDQLVQQLSVRSILLHVPGWLRPYAEWLGPSLLRLEAAVPPWLSGNAGTVFGRRWKQRARLRERNDHLITLYRAPRAVDEIYGEWVSHLLRSVGDRIHGPIVYVEAASRSLGRKRFKRLFPEQRSTWMGVPSDVQEG